MEIYDPRRPEIRADPYAAFAELRTRAPVSWSGCLRGWLVTRYRDVRAALLDVRFRSDRVTPLMAGLPPARRLALAGLERILARWTLFADPPAHARLREALGAAFRPSAIAALRGPAQTLAAQLADRAATSGSLELIGDFAAPFAAGVIGILLGLPASEVSRFAAALDDVSVFLGGSPGAANAYDRAAYRLTEVEAELRALLRRRRTESRANAIDALAGAQTGAALDEDELIASLMLILFAGYQTATGLIGNGVLALLRHPAELTRLRSDSGLAPSAVEELARYDGPTAWVTRTAGEDVEIAGRRIRRGDRLFLVIASANRDDAEFPDPDRLDVARFDNRHLAFGHGAHDCLGAPVARLQTEIALQTLLARWGRIELADEPTAWRDGGVLRGPTALNLSVGPR